MSDQNPSANVPTHGADEPLGDRGHGDQTWTPPPGEQGISNRVGDEDPGPDSDPTSFGHDGKNVVSVAEEEPNDDEFDDDEDDEADDDDGDAPDAGGES